MLFREKFEDGTSERAFSFPASTVAYAEEFARSRLLRGCDPDGYVENVVAFSNARESNPSEFDRALTTIALESGGWAILGAAMAIWDLTPDDMDVESWSRLAPRVSAALTRCNVSPSLTPFFLLNL